jgi:FixJ family two-component response regulator
VALIYILEDDANIQEIETYALMSSSFSVQAFAKAAEFRPALEKENRT